LNISKKNQNFVLNIFRNALDLITKKKALDLVCFYLLSITIKKKTHMIKCHLHMQSKN